MDSMGGSNSASVGLHVRGPRTMRLLDREAARATAIKDAT